MNEHENVIDPLDPKNYTSLTLEQLRRMQDPGSDKFAQDPQSDELKAYWERVRNSKAGFAKVELSEVIKKFKEAIKTYELKVKKKWETSHIRSQLNETVYHLAELINGDTDKSLFLMGERGCGKTTIMEEFYFPTYRFFKRCNYIEKVPSYSILLKESDLIGTALNHCWIDDLGTEIKHVRPITPTWTPGKDEIANQVFYILDKRRTTGKITHVTTNLSMAELSAIYGNRISWRFDEQFEFVKF